MDALHHGEPRTMFRELLDWYEEPFLTLRPYLTQPIRVEDYFEDSRYVIRADLAGIDPEKDLELTTGAGYVTIHAQRSTAMEVKLRSEFRYGAFSRTLQLPAGVDEADMKADYRDGILTITFGRGEGKQEAVKKIQITT
jgi:HSP20 family protein